MVPYHVTVYIYYFVLIVMIHAVYSAIVIMVRLVLPHTV